jgi:selenocysteine lyase/cysteine desulfurase
VLVAISHVPTSSGRVYDAAAVGAAAEAAGVPFLLDACQSAGQMPLDVQHLRCDVLTGAARAQHMTVDAHAAAEAPVVWACCTAAGCRCCVCAHAGTSRKYLRGPRGIGFLYARGRRQPLQDSTASQQRTPPQPQSGVRSGAGQQQPRGTSSSGGNTGVAGWEPAMIDVHGARWLGLDSYELVQGAAAYEQYEVSFAAKVRSRETQACAATGTRRRRNAAVHDLASALMHMHTRPAGGL